MGGPSSRLPTLLEGNHLSAFKFIHAADVHLDSPLRGLEAYPGAPLERLRLATRRAMDNLVRLCIDEQVDFLVIAGDLFDTDCRDFQSALSATAQLQQLGHAGIPVYLILGNHDSHFEQTRRVPWPKNVTLFDHRQPQTVMHPHLPLALHGMSYPQRSVTENLVPRYPAPQSGCFNLGLLHTNAGGNPDHDAYAPCSVEELVGKGYQYWALGHVHDYQVLHAEPTVVYSGNTQGRHARELGRKGCLLVEVDGQGRTSHAFRETDVLRWFRGEVVLDADDGEDELLERARLELARAVGEAAGRLAAVRLTVRGRSRIHTQLCRDAYREQMQAHLRALAGEFGDEVWLEKIRFQTLSPIDVQALRAGQDLVGQLLRELAATREQPEQLERLAEPLRPLLTRVAGELQADCAHGEWVDIDDPQRMQQWLHAAEEILLSYLVEERP
jgi:DNA repair protein SbcD/Mre11